MVDIFWDNFAVLVAVVVFYGSVCEGYIVYSAYFLSVVDCKHILNKQKKMKNETRQIEENNYSSQGDSLPVIDSLQKSWLYF